MSFIATLKGLRRQLTSPFRYYDFFNAPKFAIDVIIPIAFAAITYVVFAYVPYGVLFLGNNGFVASINGLLQLLVGFFVAGLAIVFGARSQALEQPPVGFTYTGTIKTYAHDGVRVTRRMFVCTLFAYLAFVSFSLFLLGVLAISCAHLIDLLAVPVLLRQIARFVYLCFIWNIFFVTLYGFYYMADRMHRADIEVLNGPVADSDDE